MVTVNTKQLNVRRVDARSTDDTVVLNTATVGQKRRRILPELVLDTSNIPPLDISQGKTNQKSLGALQELIFFINRRERSHSDSRRKDARYVPHLQTSFSLIR